MWDQGSILLLRACWQRLLAGVRPEFRRDVLAFAADDPVFGGAACRVGLCGRVSFSSTGLCNAHYQRWSKQERPDLEDFSAAASPLTGARLRGHGDAPGGGYPDGASSIDLRDLSPQSRLEMQYVLQSRRDEMAGKARPRVVQKIVRLLADSRARSLLDQSVQEWCRDFPSARTAASGGSCPMRTARSGTSPAARAGAPSTRTTPGG